MNITPNPFLTIWTSPRETIRRIIDYHPRYCVFWLAALAGISQTLDKASWKNTGDKIPLPYIMLIAIILGPVSGLVGLWIGSLLVRWTGQWMGGTATREHIAAAIAWANVPAVFGLGITCLEVFLFGDELFKSDTPRIDDSIGLTIALFGLCAVECILFVWSLVLVSKTTAEVQGFASAWKGMGNLILALVVAMVALALIAALLVLFILGIPRSR